MGEKDKPLFIISVAAELCAVHPQTLRMYERKGLLTPKRAKDRRLYSEADIEKLRYIQVLTKEAGINLAGVKRILDLRSDLESAAASIATLEQEMIELRAQMKEEIAGLSRGRSTQIVKISRGEMIKFEPRRKRY